MDNEDPAWLQYRARFADVYDAANYERPMQSATMHAGHKLAERRFTSADHYANVLEVGAGTGEHVPFVRHTFDRYVLSDSDENTLEAARRKLEPKFGATLYYETQAAEHLSYEDNSFDRLIAAHVLEHIYQPHLAIKEWQRVIAAGGVLTVLIPTDPGLAWRLARHLGPRRHALAQGISYDYVMAREHVNSSTNLIALLRHYFPQRSEAWWPIPIPSVDVNLFFVFHAVIRKSGRS